MLNKEQLEIIDADINKNICILACAGSGKTTTILHRVENLIRNHGIKPNQVLITAFNISAAEDISQRLYSLIPDVRGYYIGTIDSLAVSVLNHNNLLTDKLYHVKEYIHLFNEFLDSAYSQEFKSQVRYLFIDEFQDINQEQFDFIYKMYCAGCKITVVGDDYQNIYTFRDSNIEFILNFEKYFENAQTFVLSRNYRSTPEIINIANDVISYNRNQKHKMMLAHKDTGSKPVIVNKKKWSQIYSYILETIRNGNSLNSVAVLSRNNSSLYDLEAYFTLAGIPTVLLETFEDTKVVQRKGHVTLSTIHKSKGLEWDTVFIIGLNDKYFPASRESLEEERRLFYVATTRAKNNLYFFVSGSAPTRFLKEIKKENVKLEGMTYKALLESELVETVSDREPEFSISNLTYAEIKELKEPLLNIEVSKTSISTPITIPTFFVQNNLFNEFTNFITYVIKKQKSKTINLSIQHERFLNSVFLTKTEFENVKKVNFDDLAFRSNYSPWTLNSIEHKIISSANSLDLHPLELVFEKKMSVKYFEIYISHLKNSIRKFALSQDWSEIIQEMYLTALLPFIKRSRMKALFTDISCSWIDEVKESLISINDNLRVEFEENRLDDIHMCSGSYLWMIKYSDEIKLEWLVNIEAKKVFIFNPLSGNLTEIKIISDVD